MQDSAATQLAEISKEYPEYRPILSELFPGFPGTGEIGKSTKARIEFFLSHLELAPAGASAREEFERIAQERTKELEKGRAERAEENKKLNKKFDWTMELMNENPGAEALYAVWLAPHFNEKPQPTVDDKRKAKDWLEKNRPIWEKSPYMDELKALLEKLKAEEKPPQ
jgi:hypothetical protein